MPDHTKSIATKSNLGNKNAVELVATYSTLALTVDCVIFGFEDNSLKVLLMKTDFPQFEEKLALLGAHVHASEDLNAAANRVLFERTGMKKVYLEQVHTFSKTNRHPGGRVITTAYATFLNMNDYSLDHSANELKWYPVNQVIEMAFDHKEILDFCYGWLQKRIQEHPLALNLLPEKFSLRQLQNVYEAILDTKLDRRNFRKKFASMGFLIDTNEMETQVTHRPGKLYKFDFEQYQLRKKNWIGIDF